MIYDLIDVIHNLFMAAAFSPFFLHCHPFTVYAVFLSVGSSGAVCVSTLKAWRKEDQAEVAKMVTFITF